MLKFYRKIRKQLAYDNNLSKYSRYAFGEIFLVVIGILIALQINNWNEKRKDSLRATAYMHRITEDLDRSIKRSTRLAEMNRSILKSVTETQLYLERGTELTTEERETVEYALLWFPRTTYLLPSMLTYEEMKESGDLYLIEDITLRNELAEFYSYLLQVKAVYEKLSNDVENQFGVYNSKIRAHTDPDTLEITFDYDFNEMSKDALFINTFSRMAIHWRGFVYFMEGVNRLSMELHSKIEASLNP